MNAEEKKELMAIVKMAVENDINHRVGKGKKMPGASCCDNVTEIIIRCGSPGGVQMLSLGSPCTRTCSCSSSSSATAKALVASLSGADEELFTQVAVATLNDPEELAQKLVKKSSDKKFPEAIRDYAASIGIRTRSKAETRTEQAAVEELQEAAEESQTTEGREGDSNGEEKW